jgi:hypothetical protein
MTEKYPLLTRRQLEIINRKSLAYSWQLQKKTICWPWFQRSFMILH